MGRTPAVGSHGAGVDLGSNDLDHAVVGDLACQRVAGQVGLDGQCTQSVVGFDASAALGELLIVVEHVNHRAQVPVGQARIVDPDRFIGSRSDVVGEVV